jgi:mono/diheme cytochrome c family protein
MKRTLALLFVLILAVAVAGLLYARSLVRRGFSAHDQPSAFETFLARTMQSASIPDAYRNASNPWTGRATPDVMAEARRHFADHCSTCHGNDGSGQSETGTGLYPKPPDMRLPATQNRTDGELYYIIENGVRMTGMPAWGDPDGGLQDDDSWKLVLFIRRLPQLTPDELKDMEDYNPKGKFDEEYEHEGAGHHHH